MRPVPETGGRQGRMKSRRKDGHLRPPLLSTLRGRGVLFCLSRVFWRRLRERKGRRGGCWLLSPYEWWWRWAVGGGSGVQLSS